MVWLTTRLIYVSRDHGVAYHTSHIRIMTWCGLPHVSRLVTMVWLTTRLIYVSRDHGVAYHTSHIRIT